MRQVEGEEGPRPEHWSPAPWAQEQELLKRSWQSASSHELAIFFKDVGHRLNILKALGENGTCGPQALGKQWSRQAGGDRERRQVSQLRRGHWGCREGWVWRPGDPQPDERTQEVQTWQETGVGALQEA